jgi:radical SAM protein with 4Fe4S-binding SPASM domain
VFTGGDVMKRADIFDMVAQASALNLQPSVMASITPLFTDEAVCHFADVGLDSLSIGLDGSCAAYHDEFRGIAGSYTRTLWVIQRAREAGIKVIVNTVITSMNYTDIDAMAELLSGLGIDVWLLFFFIPACPAITESRISAQQAETIFEHIYLQSKRQPYYIDTFEGAHYRRYVDVQQKEERAIRPADKPVQFEKGLYVPLGLSDGRGEMYVSHVGALYPGMFLTVCCGRFPHDSLLDVYQHSPVFEKLRDADQLKGKCGECEYREICGGSRARAYQLTHDMMAADPDCGYVPAEGTIKRTDSPANAFSFRYMLSRHGPGRSRVRPD